MKKIVDLVIFIFSSSQSVNSGGLFVLHGLVVTVGERIAPHISTFCDYLACAINMQNTDEMGVRLACGLISDLGNHCPSYIVQFLPKIMQALENVMSGENYETEAKIHAIIAMGDACLASEQNFANYLPKTMTAFMNASHASIQRGVDEDQEALLMKLRTALIDGYISIIHGMNPEKDENGQPKNIVLQIS